MQTPDHPTGVVNAAKASSPTPLAETSATPNPTSSGAPVADAGLTATQQEPALQCRFVLDHGMIQGPCPPSQLKSKEMRKCVSDFFGRNKHATTQIKTWVLICRKHYQRIQYNEAFWAVYKGELLKRQLDNIEDEKPGTRYAVSLQDDLQHRVTVFYEKLNEGADQEHLFGIDDKIEGKRDMLLRDLVAFHRTFVQERRPRSREEIKQAIDEVLRLLAIYRENKLVMNHFPSMEFLPLLNGASLPKRANTNRPVRSSSQSPTRPRKKVRLF